MRRSFCHLGITPAMDLDRHPREPRARWNPCVEAGQPDNGGLLCRSICTKRTSRAGPVTDSTRQPAAAHAAAAGDAGQPSASVHHDADIAASGKPKHVNSRTLSIGRTHDLPPDRARYGPSASPPLARSSCPESGSVTAARFTSMSFCPRLFAPSVSLDDVTSQVFSSAPRLRRSSGERVKGYPRVRMGATTVGRADASRLPLAEPSPCRRCRSRESGQVDQRFAIRHSGFEVRHIEWLGDRTCAERCTLAGSRRARNLPRLAGCAMHGCCPGDGF